MLRYISKQRITSLVSTNLRHLFAWAQHHPGTLVVGALVVATLLAAPAVRKSPPHTDSAAEDVPLFI
ncbi:MAG TPA: hypothetical protein VM182_09045 [Terriglobia bacterium]|nr:hypothetical protein [Terriglobia bacterium]